MRHFIQFFLIVAAIIITSSFKYEANVKIILKEYPGVTFRPNGRKNEIIYKNYKEGFLKILLYDIRGKMALECFSKDSILQERGSYINSLSLLRKYSTATSPEGSFIKVVEYYEPLRDGSWYFYDSLGVLKDSIMYKKGINVSSNK